jgi:hypothetical protein
VASPSTKCDAQRICLDLTKFRNASKALFLFLKAFSWNGRVERLGFDEVCGKDSFRRIWLHVSSIGFRCLAFWRLWWSRISPPTKEAVCVIDPLYEVQDVCGPHSFFGSEWIMSCASSVFYFWWPSRAFIRLKESIVLGIHGCFRSR